jgi:tRNA (cmo5U34)-methyltransferase
VDDGRSESADAGARTGSEADWRTYRRLAPAAVPARAEQIATLLTLFPFGSDDSFRVVEVGTGEGHLSHAVLELFPNASVLALDGSSEMLDLASARLARFGDRARTNFFELASADWQTLVEGADVVISSLCLHHLDDEGKRSLFASLRTRLSERGAILIADLVAPRRAEAERLFAETWDHSVERQSQSATGSGALFDLFVSSQWNIYRYPDPMDTPSPLFDQLRWLDEAGFSGVDCFWMQAGHAIYGGFCTSGSGAPEGVSFTSALRVAEAVLLT